MSDKLRPCYFKHEIKSDLYLADNIGDDFGGNTPYTEFWVQCDDCGARGPKADTEEKAISAWNHRPVEDALVEALEDVDSTLCVCRHCIPPKGCNCDIHAAHRLIDAALKLAKEGRNER